MTATLRTAEDVVNFALRRIGSPLRVDNLLDGSRQADAAIRVYGQERDTLLAGGQWDFCARRIPGILLKQAPASYVVTPWTTAYPPLPWKYEYAYPPDAVEIRTVVRQAIIIPNFDPRYNRSTVANDTGPQTVPGYDPPLQVVLCNVPDAILVYTGQVTDPTEWTSDFTEALAARLGKALAPVLRDLNAAKLAAAEEQVDTAQAMETRA